MDIYIEISPDSLVYQSQSLPVSNIKAILLYTSFNKDVKEQPWVRAVCI